MLWILVFGVFFVSSNGSNLPKKTKDIFSVEGNDAALSAMCDDVAFKFENEYINFMETREETPELRELTQQLLQFHKKNTVDADSESQVKANQIYLCTMCRATVNVVTRMFRSGGEFSGPRSRGALKTTLLEFCNRFELHTEEVCEGVVDFNLPIFKFILDESDIDTKTFCSTFNQFSFCHVPNNKYNWKIAIDHNGPAIKGPKKEIPERGIDDLKILHITDLHYDPLYEPGSLAECAEPLCCQRHKDIAVGTSKAAGYWGDYRVCDIPWHTIVDSLDHIKKTHQKIDYIYHTGDVIDHAVWITSREKNTKVLEQVNQHLKATFGDIPVYPTVGNHESQPLNVFAPHNITNDEVSSRWLYELLADLWSVWLPPSTKETIIKGGYYTVSPRPGFRIIALNNNECGDRNWWIVYDASFMSVQLNWLHDVLLHAEKEGEYVHILTHIPSGDKGCWSIWSREFGRIVERFSQTISGIFNGHTHTDELSLYYSNGTIPINIAWNGGSLTTFVDKNPNYKMYQVEPESFQVIDQEVWYFNLTTANLNPNKSPKWELEYNMLKEFKLKDLSPASIDELLSRFAEEPSLLRKYWRFHIVQGDPFLAKGCNAKCLKELICTLARGDNTQTKRCQDLQLKLQESLDGEAEKESSGIASSIAELKITTLLTIFFGLRYLL